MIEKEKIVLSQTAYPENKAVTKMVKEFLQRRRKMATTKLERAEVLEKARRKTRKAEAKRYWDSEVKK